MALSRATSLRGTRVLSFDPARVRAHPKVARFYQVLEQQALRERPPPPPQPPPQQPGAPSSALQPAAAASPSAPSQPSQGPPGGVTAEQLARMTANREAALARRRAAQQFG